MRLQSAFRLSECDHFAFARCERVLKCEKAWLSRRTSGLGLLHDVLELSEAVELPGQVLELGLARLEVQLQVQRRARLHRARRRKRLGSPV